MRFRVPSSFRSPLASLFLLGACGGVCAAPSALPEPLLRERGPIAEKHVRERLAMWQQRLKLDDWKINLTTVGPDRLRRGTLGSIRWDEAKKTAQIRVLDAAHYDRPLTATLRDMEFTLVHELIHLELASLPRTEESRILEEQVVNRMADALLALDRGESDRPRGGDNR